MMSVKTDDEPVKTAAVAVAQERVATAWSTWASVESHLVLRVKLTAWTCKARRRRMRTPGNAENEGGVFSATERAFRTRFVASTVP